MNPPVVCKPARAIIEGNPALLVFKGAAEYPEFSALLGAVREQGAPVIFAEAAQRRLAEGLAAARPGEHWIDLPRLSAFLGTALSLLLRQRNVQTLLVAGGRTNVEVHYSFVDAHQNDFFCRVAEDCMAAEPPALQEGALKAMEYLQTGARQTAAALVRALKADRAHRPNP
jgi:isochorismate hydrolase